MKMRRHRGIRAATSYYTRAPRYFNYDFKKRRVVKGRVIMPSDYREMFTGNIGMMYGMSLYSTGGRCCDRGDDCDCAETRDCK